MQERRNSIANAPELRISGTNPSNLEDKKIRQVFSYELINLLWDGSQQSYWEINIGLYYTNIDTDGGGDRADIDWTSIRLEGAGSMSKLSSIR